MTVVLDTSAVLALTWAEPGADAVERNPGRATISAANLARVAAKLVNRGLTDAQVAEALADFGVLVEPMPEAQGVDAGLPRRPTRALGLSLGDRVWTALDVGVTVEVIR